MTIIIFYCLCINKKLIKTHKQSRWVINIKLDENIVVTTE